jgi:hypothetical protein
MNPQILMLSADEVKPASTIQETYFFAKPLSTVSSYTPQPAADATSQSLCPTLPTIGYSMEINPYDSSSFVVKNLVGLNFLMKQCAQK